MNHDDPELSLIAHETEAKEAAPVVNLKAAAAIGNDEARKALVALGEA